MFQRAEPDVSRETLLKEKEVSSSRPPPSLIETLAFRPRKQAIDEPQTLIRGISPSELAL